MSKGDRSAEVDETLARLDELEEIYRAAPVGLCLVDAEFRFLRINDRLAAISGRAAADLIGRKVEEVVPELAAQILPRYRKVVETGHGVENVEVYNPDTRRTWLVHDRPVLDAQGRVGAIVTVVTDITTMKAKEAQVRLGQERLRRAEHVAKLGCWEWHLQRDEMWWSDEYHRNFGYEPGECTPSYDLFIEHVVSEDRGLIREQLEAIYAGRDQASAAFRITTVSGEERDMHAIATLRRDEHDAPLILFGTTQDVSEQRAVEARWDEERVRYEATIAELEALLQERTGELDRALDRIRRGR